jgi:hypothetical protein
MWIGRPRNIYINCSWIFSAGFKFEALKIELKSLQNKHKDGNIKLKYIFIKTQIQEKEHDLMIMANYPRTQTVNPRLRANSLICICIWLETSSANNPIISKLVLVFKYS